MAYPGHVPGNMEIKTMCFGGGGSSPPPVPPPDPAIEAQKYQQFQDSSARISDEKKNALSQQRAAVYGLFGRRSLLGDLTGGGMLQTGGNQSGKLS